MQQIIYNAIRTPDGTVLESRHRHDFKQYVDKNLQYYAVDGGQDYLKRAYDTFDYVELSLYDTDPIEKIREHFTWGTRGPKCDQPVKYVKLKDLDTLHIQNIIRYIKEAFPDGNFVSNVMEQELSFRNGA